MTRPTHTDLRVLSRRSPGFRRGARERLWYLGAPMRACFLLFVPVVSAACALPPPPDVSPDADPRDAAPGPDAAIDGPPGTYHVGGTVSGMWDGGAVALRLQGPGVDDLETVSANSGFNFDSVLDDGASYSVTVATQPEHHTCAVVDGAGTIAGGDVTTIGIDCEGPAVAVSLSLPYPFAFDPAATSQSLDVSIVAQEVSATVTSVEATAITVGGVPVTSGVPSAPQSLAFGANALAIRVESDSVSRQWTLDIDRGAATLAQAAYVKASNTGANDGFGAAVDADGSLLVIGAAGEDSNAVVINGSQSNESAIDAGAAYVFRRVGTSWSQEAYLKPNNTGAGDAFGSSVAVSGTRIVVGAPGEDGPTNSVSGAGAAYVFVHNGVQWTLEATLRAADATADDAFGTAVSIDGDVVVVGAPGTQLGDLGAAYVFRRNGTTWSQEQKLTRPDSVGLAVGTRVAVDGDLVAASAIAVASGTLYLFRRSGGAWGHEATLAADSELFGVSIAIEGLRLAVGATMDSCDGTGVNPSCSGDTLGYSGAVYVFRRDGDVWNQEAFVKASNAEEVDYFGQTVELRGDLMVATSLGEDSSSPGVDAIQGDNAANGAGAAYVFRRSGNSWTQVHYVKASNPDESDTFSFATLSADALVVGARGEDSAAVGLEGDQGDTAAGSGSGAAYAFR